MFREGGPRPIEDDDIPTIRLRPERISLDDAIGADQTKLDQMNREIAEAEAMYGVENKPEKVAEKKAEKAIESVGTKDGGDPIISLDWIKDGKKWLKDREEKLDKYIEVKKEKYDKWAKENPKKATAISITTGAVRVGFVLAFKIAWGLIKFSYEAIKNKGKVPNAYKIGKEMFSFDEKDGKK